jgi:para-nitrobenzyl esterase
MVATRVRTREGVFRGEELDGVVRFAGLPYAVAPDPAQPRFSPPAPPPQFSKVRDATTFGPVAPQPKAAPGFLPGEAADQDEECRTLNVWAPVGDHARLPVLVFVHGGAFISGSGSSRLYDGEHLARLGAVVVTFNYRLGALGFLAHEALEVPGFGCANWGLADQLAALGWVGANAQAFGGDPAKVTVFGESAGAMSVCDLLGMKKAAGLFQRAILESGAALARPLQVASGATRRLARLLGTPVSRPALASVPLDELLAAQQEVVASIDEGLGMPFAPAIDGGLLASYPEDQIAMGSPAGPIELLAGTNRDEFRFFTFLSGAANGLDDAGLEALVGGYLSSAGLTSRISPAEVIEVYRDARRARGEAVEPKALLEAFGTDFIFRVPVMRLLDAHRRRGGRTFAYLFDWPSPFAGGSLGSCHALELPFVFGSLREPIVGVFSGNGADALALSEKIEQAWVRFAAAGDPSCELLGHWPAYEDATRSTMVLGPTCGVVERPGEPERRYWEERLGRYGSGGPIEGAAVQGVAFLDPSAGRRPAQG